MQLALIQLRPTMLQVAANLECALGLMRGVAADLYLLPELFSSGYTFQSQEELASVAESAQAGPTLAAMADFASDRQVHVVYGFPERRGDAFFNSANLVGPAGLIGTYRKIHLFGREKLFFAAGTEPAPVHDLPWGRLGLMICFDWFFPELARSLALRGADLIVQPANLVLPHCPQAMITRSLENRVFTATCDRVGTESHGGATHRFIGMSQIVSPSGELLLRMSGDREEAAVVTLDLALAGSKKLGEHNDLFADRQPALYS